MNRRRQRRRDWSCRRSSEAVIVDQSGEREREMRNVLSPKIVKMKRIGNVRDTLRGI